MDTKLTSVEEGKLCTIQYINAGQKATKRLFEMGLHTGALARVKKNDNMGPLILGIHGSNVAVGRRIADNIFVKVGE